MISLVLGGLLGCYRAPTGATSPEGLPEASGAAGAPGSAPRAVRPPLIAPELDGGLPVLIEGDAGPAGSPALPCPGGALAPAWTLQGAENQVFRKLVADEQGNLYWLGLDALYSSTPDGELRFALRASADDLLYDQGRLFLSNHYWIQARSAATGALLWEVDADDLPFASAGAPIWLDGTRPDGALVAHLDAWAAVTFALSASDGSLLWSSPRWGLPLGSMIGPDGLIYEGLVCGPGDSCDPAIRVLSPQGAELYRLPRPEKDAIPSNGDRPVALAGSRLFAWSTFRDAGVALVGSDGVIEVGNTFEAAGGDSDLRSPVGNDRVAFALSKGGSTSAPEAWLSVIHFGPTLQIDAHPLPAARPWVLNTTEPTLTADDRVLFARGPQHHCLGGPCSCDAAPASVEAWGADGAQQLSCGLAGPAGCLEEGVLLDGRYVVVRTAEWEVGNGQIEHTSRLEAYDLPGVAPAPRGWVTARGNAGRSNHPR